MSSDLNTVDARLNFLGLNKDWSDFVGMVSQNTGEHFVKMWVENAKLNKPLVKKYGWATEAFQESASGKTAVLLGASPAIKAQADKLRELQDDPDFVLIGISSGLRWLIDNGIYPKFVMISDADHTKIGKFWEGMDFEATKDMVLIPNLAVHPSMFEKWQGDVKFLAVYTGIKKLDKQFRKLFAPVNACGHYFPALCSQFNTGAAFAYLVLETPVLVFTGCEFSFPTRESPYYMDGRPDEKDGWERKAHINIFGEIAYTNYMFMSCKLALEDFLAKLPGYFLNATEAGIFGVNRKHGNLPWIYQLRLPMAIAQARHIMKYGEPITQNVLAAPTLSETTKYGGNTLFYKQ